jgi:uncharacterized protein (TIGR02265 family)
MRPPPHSMGPSLRQSIDVAQSIKACPVESTTTGTFFQHVREAVAKRTGGIPGTLLKGMTTDRWTPFLQYPLRDFMQLTVNAAGILHPHEPLAEGIRRIGWLAYPSFASTMAGRIVLFAFGEKLEQVVQATPRIFAVTVPGVVVTILGQSERRALLQFRGVYCFADCFMRGVLEGSIWCHGFEPQVIVTTGARPSDAEFDTRW